MECHPHHADDFFFLKAGRGVAMFNIFSLISFRLLVFAYV